MESLFEYLGIRPDLIAVNIVSFLLLLWILNKFLFKPIMAVMDQRAEDIRNTYQTAEDEKARMEQLRAEYESKMAEIAEEAREKIAAAINEGQHTKQQILEEAREKAAQILQRGHEELQREREKMLIELREQLVDLSTDVAAKVLARSLNQDDHRRLVREFIDTIGTSK